MLTLTSIVSLVLLAPAASFLRSKTAGASSDANDRCIVRPIDTEAALVNPQMGWTFHYYSNVITNYGSRLEPSDTLDDFPGLSVIYLRLPWSFIEPNEGVFNWSIVDTPAQRWIDKGKQVAFRFSCAESWIRYATPKWVEQAGAKGYNFSPGKLRDDGPYWEPNYADPVFLEKLDHFLAAAARYDGNPNVAFIDVGSFGVWGEGHTFHSTKLKYPAAVIKKHIDLHVRHFKKTLLAANDDLASQDDLEGEKIIDYAFKSGLTLRDDSILVQPPPHQYFNAAVAQSVWPRLPVVLECEHYGGSRDRGAWGDGSKYLQAVEDYHASYAAIHWWPREFLREQADLIKKINLRLGYRLQLKEISWPMKVALNTPFIVSMKLANAGVAPCYPGGSVVLTLKDAKGGIVAVLVDQTFNVRSLDVGPPDKPPIRDLTSTFTLPRNAPAGIFDLFVSVGTQDGTPVIALPLKKDDNHHRYQIGKIEIKSAAP
jgi:hypothetical protein